MIKSASQSSLTNDVKYRNMGAANVPSSEYLIETVTVGATPVPSITFNNLSQWAAVYRHLVLVVCGRDSRSQEWAVTLVRFNDDSGANYFQHTLRAFPGSSSVSSGGGGGGTSLSFELAGNSATSGVFGFSQVDILDAFVATKNTTTRLFWGRNPQSTIENSIALVSGGWNNTAAVSKIVLQPNDGSNYLSGSRFSLYGVTA